jgi:hypothetical protein
LGPLALAAAVCVGALGLCAPAALAATGNLPGGTPISVTISTPANNTVVNSPPGEVTVAGTASVGTGVARADTSLIYVIDVSGSTTDFPGAGCGGDQNNDTKVNTILDCEIAAARALNQKAIAAGTVDEVSLIFFSGTAVIQDVNPVAPGIQTTTTPSADLNTNGIPDIEEAMTKATVSEFTDFEEAVQRSCQVAQTSTNPNNIVVFMSDGFATAGGNALDDVPCAGKAATFQTFAVGSTGSCTNPGQSNQGSLQAIAQESGGTCTAVTNLATLPNIIPGVIASELTRLELIVDNGAPININANTTPTPPLPGPVTVNYSRLVSGLTVGTHTICVRAVGKDGGGTGSVTECRTVIVQAVVLPKITISDLPNIPEGNSGCAPASFTVKLDKPSTVPVTVKYATANGTATAGSDYIATSGTVTFAPGETSKTIVVQVCGDTIDEPDETFVVNLSQPTNATIADNQAVGTIIDDERNGRFSCRASALNLLGLLEPVVANRPNDPCKDDSGSLISAVLNVVGLGVTANVLNAKTDQTPNNLASSPPAVGDNARADADTAKAVISLGIAAEATDAEAKATCTGTGVPTLTTGGEVVGLNVNGRSYDVIRDQISIPLLLATLHINHTSHPTSKSIRRRAIWLDNVLLPDVVISEAIADYSGNPCDS